MTSAKEEWNYCLASIVPTVAAEEHGNTKVSDDRILLEFVLNPSPALFPSDISSEVSIGTEGIRQRLKKLENPDEHPPLVIRRDASGRNLYWLTQEGKERVSESLRQLLDEEAV